MRTPAHIPESRRTLPTHALHTHEKKCSRILTCARLRTSLSHGGHSQRTRCTPILSLSPYPPPYQPFWLVSWGGVPPTIYLPTRSPRTLQGGSHDERTYFLPYLSFVGGRGSQSEWYSDGLLLWLHVGSLDIS
jgi:hypothetical protein